MAHEITSTTAIKLLTEIAERGIDCRTCEYYRLDVTLPICIMCVFGEQYKPTRRVALLE